MIRFARHFVENCSQVLTHAAHPRKGNIDVNGDHILMGRVDNDFLLHFRCHVIAELVEEQKRHDHSGDDSHCGKNKTKKLLKA